jgi:hypothetical protein
VATDPLRQQVVTRELPKNPAADRIFFSAMIAALWATVLFGFAKTYFLAGMVRAPLPNALIHIHGAVFTLWMVLLVVQEAFIAGRKIKWHKQLGLAGFGMAVAMVILGLLAATDSVRRGNAPPGIDAKTFYIVPMAGIATFAVLVYFSYRARFRPAAHKRLILIATISIADAAIGRFPIASMQANPQLGNLVTLAFLLAVVGYDLFTLHRVHKSTLWASVFVMFVQLVRVPIGFTPLWHAFATYMGGKG